MCPEEYSDPGTPCHALNDIMKTYKLLSDHKFIYFLSLLGGDLLTLGLWLVFCFEGLPITWNPVQASPSKGFLCVTVSYGHIFLLD